MKKKFTTALGVAIAMPMSALALAVPAQAQTITTDNERWSYATGATEVTGVAQADAKIHLTYRMAAGIKLKTSEKRSSGCKKVTKGSFDRADTSRRYNCYLLYTGVTFINTGHRGGKIYAFNDVVGSSYSPGPWQKIVKRGTKYYKAGNAQGRGNCGNFVIVTGPEPTLNWTTVVLTRTATDFTYRVDLKVDLNAMVTAEATADCNTSRSSSTASGHGTVAATLSINVMAKTEVEAKAKGQSVRIEVEQVTDFKSSAEVKARLDLTAKASAWCSDSPVTPEKPAFMQFREFNDLEVNWTSDHCVTVDFPKGHSGTVFWTAEFGSFATPTKPAKDMVQVCSLYKAPSEVPVVTGGEDVITVTATDDVTGLSVTKFSKPFLIKETATHPL